MTFLRPHKSQKSLVHPSFFSNLVVTVISRMSLAPGTDAMPSINIDLCCLPGYITARRNQEWLRGDSRSIHFQLVVKIDYTYGRLSGQP
jgi:hypothetical protein